MGTEKKMKIDLRKRLEREVEDDDIQEIEQTLVDFQRPRYSPNSDYSSQRAESGYDAPRK